jgi:hypothetical protein
MDAWRTTVDIISRAAKDIVHRAPSAKEWSVCLEFEVPRRRRWIDAIILANEIIFVIEVKAGFQQFERRARWQLEQYALDLRDFHEGSRGLLLAPLLVASGAATSNRTELVPVHSLLPVQELAAKDLGQCVSEISAAIGARDATAIDANAWDTSEYRPTPSILEAARDLYDTHDVSAISHADAHNLSGTIDALLALIRECRTRKQRGIAFITGAPGSGKTLAGLQVAHHQELARSKDTAAVFLSGNMPLVEVLSRALATSGRRRVARDREERARQVSAFVQHAYLFRNHYAEDPAAKPFEHIVLFDEAQRAWDAQQVARWTRGASNASEPEILLDVMSRLDEWAVIVAMVGGGQEINRGEAGLVEWGRALSSRFPDWVIYASPEILPGAPERTGGHLFEGDQPANMAIIRDEQLHLSMNVRSPRAERLNQWVDSVLSLDLAAARSAIPDEREFPVAVTRDIALAKAWLKERAGDEFTFGLVASAEGKRLRAWGLDTNELRQEKAWAYWFLNGVGDVRSSTQLEVPATSFDCQGLELDWVGVCWANDFYIEDEEWRARKFHGTRWMKANQVRARYILNGYRVLLTRARRGQVIWVPRPDGTDVTLAPAHFDSTFEFLCAAGAQPID